MQAASGSKLKEMIGGRKSEVKGRGRCNILFYFLPYKSTEQCDKSITISIPRAKSLSLTWWAEWEGKRKRVREGEDHTTILLSDSLYRSSFFLSLGG
jgi:hypothetical protein